MNQLAHTTYLAKLSLGIALLSALFLSRCSLTNSELCTSQDPHCNPLSLIIQLRQILTPIFVPQYVYYTDSTGQVYGTSIDSSTGGITDLPGFPVGAGNSNANLVSSPFQGRVYTASSSLTTGIFSFQVQGDGSLNLLKQDTTATAPRHLEITPDGGVLFASAADILFPAPHNGTLYAFGTGDGSMTNIPNSPIGAYCSPSFVSLHPGGRFLYYGGSIGEIGVYHFDGGSISELSPNPFLSGLGYIYRAEQHPNGQFFYVGINTSGTANIYAFRVDQGSGALTPLSGSPYSVTGANLGVRGMALSPGGNFLYVAGSDNSVHVMNVNSSTGDLTFNSSVGAANSPSDLAIDAPGSYIYVTADNGAGGGFIRIYKILSDGTVVETAQSPHTTSVFPKNPSVYNAVTYD